MTRLIKSYPEYKKLFNEFRNTYSIVSCSSLFKYNLNRLMSIVINKIDSEAIFRLENFVDNEDFDMINLDKAKKMIKELLEDDNSTEG